MKISKKVYMLAMMGMIGFGLVACDSMNKEKEPMKETMPKTEMKDEKAMMKSMTGMLKGEGKYETKGMVEVKDNMLMLSEFMTSDGPDVHVWLTKDGDMEHAYDVAKLDLEAKDQTFDISMAPMSDYNTVVIYCNDAQAVFGSAMLSGMY